MRDLRAAGCKRVYIDGSFITTKEHPGDFFQRDRDGNPKGIIVIDLEDFQ